jgi:tetratricopeptide (TPR) repeat protein
MLARYLFLAIIALGALAAAVKLAPGDLERLAMLERDGRYEQAMGELQQLYADGQRGPQLMLRLFNLKVRFGQVDEAREILEAYAKLRPSDTEAQIGLIRFYQTNLLEEPYVAALRSLQERTRTRELLAELLGFYRMNGRFRDEEDLLERTASANRAGPAEFERLGLLAAARGDLQRAVWALRRADGRPDEPSRPARLGLFRVLIELKENDEAHQRSLVWLRTWRDPELAVALMEAFSQAGRSDLALDIGGRFGGPGNDVTLASAELLSEMGRHDEALQKLRDYQSTGLPEDPERAQRFISASSTSGGADMAVRAARLIGLRKIEASVVLDLLDSLQDAMEASSRPFPIELVRGFSAEIEARMQNIAPVAQEASDRLQLGDEMRLFVSQLALLDNDRELARKHLAAVDPDRLNTFELSRWTELQLASGLRSTAFPNVPVAWRRREGSDTLTRRLRRIERAPPAQVQVIRPRPSGGVTTTTSNPGPGVAATSPSADAQAAQQETNAARARRNRRRAAAIDRQRERSRLAVQRRAQQSQSAAPSPKVTPPPPQPTPFTLPSSGG